MGHNLVVDETKLCANVGHIDVPGSVKGVNLIMVTSEPSGGSVVPTSPPVITAPV